MIVHNTGVVWGTSLYFGGFPCICSGR